MAFGDIAEVVEVSQDSGTTISATLSSATPAADDLLSAGHFTGAAASSVDTAGFTSDQHATDTTENDDLAAYSKKCASGADNTVTCSSADDEQMLILTLYRGPFPTTPKDLSDFEMGDSSGSIETGASAGSTAQADELMVAFHSRRTATLSAAAWTRQGTATPTSDMTTLTGGGVASSFKSLVGASQVLTAIGTVGILRDTGAVRSNILYVTYKKAAAGGTTAGPLINSQRLKSLVGGALVA
jgi:hypothetical protein